MRKHILLVDDEPDIREILAQALQARGYRTSSAEAVHEALRIAKSDPPNLLLSDLQMEDADGFALIEEINQLFPNLPIILLTGMIFDSEVIRETINKKVACYLDKTSSLQKVMQEVQRLLGDLKPDAAVVPN